MEADKNDSKRIDKENSQAIEQTKEIPLYEDISDTGEEVFRKGSCFDSPLIKQWVDEYGPDKTTISYYGCICRLKNGSIYISNDLEQWQLRYSEQYDKLVLYHKNVKNRVNKDIEPVKGYHVQYVQSINNLNADECSEFLKPQVFEYSNLKNFKGKPTIQDYLLYICQHRELTEKKIEEKNKMVSSLASPNRQESYVIV